MLKRRKTKLNIEAPKLPPTGVTDPEKFKMKKADLYKIDPFDEQLSTLDK